MGGKRKTAGLLFGATALLFGSLGWGSAAAQAAPRLSESQEPKPQLRRVVPAQEQGTWSFRPAVENAPPRYEHLKPLHPQLPAELAVRSSGDFVRWKPKPATLKSMQQVMDVLRAADPAPHLSSYSYSVHRLSSNPEYRYVLEVHVYKMEFDAAGKLQSINIFNDGLGHQVRVRVNTAVQNTYTFAPALFQLHSGLSFEGGKGPTHRALGPLYLVPPLTQGEVASLLKAHSFVPSAQPMGTGPYMGGVPGVGFRAFSIACGISNCGRDEGVGEVHRWQNWVWLSRDGQLPFEFITRGQFLDLMQVWIEEQRSAGKYILGSYTPECFAVVQAIRQAYEGRLGQAAVINSAHFEFIKGNLHTLCPASQKPTAQAVATVFVEQPTEGWRVGRYKADAYKDMQDGEVRTLLISWPEDYRPVHSPHHGTVQPGKRNEYSDAPGNLAWSMRNTFDWKALHALVKP